jgi:cytochrome oxidase assembly protein ShyY1
MADSSAAHIAPARKESTDCATRSASIRADAGNVEFVLRLLVRTRWIALSLLVVALVVVFIELGQWQLRRLDDRRAVNAAVSASASRAPTALDELPSGSAAEWTLIAAEGRYDADGELLVRNRPLDGTNGFHVVTPFVTENDQLLLVLRGWVPAGTTAKETPDVPPPPRGDVSITGRLRTSESARRDLQADVPGQVTSLDTQAIANLLDEPVYEDYIELTAQDPPAGDVPRLLPAPEISEGPHLAYAVQWFAFAAIAIGGWVMLSRRELLDASSGGGQRDHRNDQRPAGVSRGGSDR